MRKGAIPADRREPIGADATRGWGPHKSRVDFDVTVAMGASVTPHPVDEIEPLDDIDADRLRRWMLAFVHKFANMTMEHRHVICLRAMGYTWNTIRVEMRHASRQASHNLFKDALRANPRVARMFNHKQGG